MHDVTLLPVDSCLLSLMAAGLANGVLAHHRLNPLDVRTHVRVQIVPWGTAIAIAAQGVKDMYTTKNQIPKIGSKYSQKINT